MPKEKSKYDYDRFGKKGKRVGQAVVDILSKEQAPQTAEETLDALGPDFVKDLLQCAEDNQPKYGELFYILVLTKKEMWAANVVRNFFIARQTPPHALDLIKEYSNFTKTLYKVSVHEGVSIVWSIPGHQECLSIMKTPQSFDESLVKWITEAYQGNLDRDAYSGSLVCQ